MNWYVIQQNRLQKTLLIGVGNMTEGHFFFNKSELVILTFQWCPRCHIHHQITLLRPTSWILDYMYLQKKNNSESEMVFNKNKKITAEPNFDTHPIYSLFPEN